MYSLRFETQAPVIVADPNRTDIACFVGFVARRTQPPPAETMRWLDERGWALPESGRSPLEELLDVPVPVDSWDVFDLLFDWDHRPLDEQGQTGTSYLGAAVRSFFAQGGRKCYIVRVGDPVPFSTTQGNRPARMTDCLEKLVPGYPHSVSASPVDQASWRGVGHLFGLPEVSFLCMPDLADVVGVEPEFKGEPDPLPQPGEQFVECSVPQPAGNDRETRLFRAPHCDETGYDEWAKVLQVTADLVARQRREVQLVAAVPIPDPAAEAARNLLAFLVDEGRGPLAVQLQNKAKGLTSAFVQLVYPWARTPGSTNLPGQLESPDGILVGVLARNALMRGTFRSAASLPLGDVYDLYPVLRRDQVLTAIRDKPENHDTPDGSRARHTLLERISLLGPTPGGLRVLSDVTTSLDESYRPASVNRLVSAIVRAARRLGEDMVFEVSNERQWKRVRDRLNRLLLGLLRAGALRGQRPAEAFQVRCDRSTMSQNDIDNGRIIVHVQFDAAAPIEGITVVLVMDEGGQVSLLSIGAS